MSNVSNQECSQKALIRHLNSPTCAENDANANFNDATCINSQSTTMATRAYSEMMDISSVTATSSSRDKEITEENNMWVYGTIVGAVVSITLVVIVFVMSTSIVCWKCRTKQRGKPLHVYQRSRHVFVLHTLRLKLNNAFVGL